MAAYAGAAPIEASSAGVVRHRLDRDGNCGRRRQDTTLPIADRTPARRHAAQGLLRNSQWSSPSVGLSPDRGSICMRPAPKVAALGLAIMILVVGVGVSVLFLSTQPPTAAEVTGTLYTCDGSLSHCMARPADTTVLTFHQEALIRSTVTVSTKNGQYSARLPVGKYEVHVQGCKRFPASDFNPPVLIVTSHDLERKIVEDWTIDSFGDCSAFSPLIQE